MLGHGDLPRIERPRRLVRSIKLSLLPQWLWLETSLMWTMAGGLEIDNNACRDRGWPQEPACREDGGRQGPSCGVFLAGRDCTNRRRALESPQ